MAQRKLILWKYKARVNTWEGTIKGDTEPLIFIEGGLCVTDVRESRKSGFGKDYVSPKSYNIMGLPIEERKQLAEDLVTGANFEKHEANRLAWEAKSQRTADLIQSTQKFLDDLKKKEKNVAR